jgi:hypothetical protein
MLFQYTIFRNFSAQFLIDKINVILTCHEWVLPGNKKPPTTNHQLPTTNHQLPTTNHQPPTTNHQPPTTNHQPPTTNHQPLTIL